MFNIEKLNKIEKSRNKPSILSFSILILKISYLMKIPIIHYLTNVPEQLEDLTFQIYDTQKIKLSVN